LPAKAWVGYVVQERRVTESATLVLALMRPALGCNGYCWQHRSWQWH